jgi:hypothetical protein
VTAAIAELEKKYNVSLAVAVMKVMVKEIAVRDLPQYFVFEYNLGRDQAEALVEEMKERVFVGVADYLGITKKKKKKEEAESLEEWLDFKKKETQRREAKFYFSPEDEEEVKEIAKKTENLKPRISDEEYEEILKKITSKLKFNFSSEELYKRFRQVINTYIRGIRNKINTKQTLMKEVASGGLDLNDDLVSRILAVADKVKNEYEEKMAKEKPSEDGKREVDEFLGNSGEVIDKQKVRSVTEKNKEKIPSVGVRDVEYDFSALAEQKNKPAAKTVAKTQTIKEKAKVLGKTKKEEKLLTVTDFDTAKNDLKTVNSKIINKKPGAEIGKTKLMTVGLKKESLESKVGSLSGNITEGAMTPEEDQPATVTIGKTTSFSIAQARRGQTADGKVKIEDVKKAPKLTGPVDELGEMDLVDFRRLNPDPQVAAKKIKEKVESLEEKGGYVRRLAGIRAWRQSPLNHLYLQIGQESINQKKSVKEIIGRRRENGEKYLTLEEFNAIMELNRELRF